MTHVITVGRAIEKKILTLYKRHIYLKWNYAKWPCEPFTWNCDSVQTERQWHSPWTWSVQLHYIMHAGMHTHTRTEPRQRFPGWEVGSGWANSWSYLMCCVIMWNWVLNRTLNILRVKRQCQIWCFFVLFYFKLSLVLGLIIIHLLLIIASIHVWIGAAQKKAAPLALCFIASC